MSRKTDRCKTLPSPNLRLWEVITFIFLQFDDNREDYFPVLVVSESRNSYVLVITTVSCQLYSVKFVNSSILRPFSKKSAML